MASIKEILERAETAQPIAKNNDKDIVSFDDYRNLATVANMNGEDLGGVMFNPDGSMARTKCTMAAVNLDDFYANKFKKVKNKYYVVTDLMAIREVERTGQAPYQHINGFLIGEKDGQVVCEKPVIISAEDFIADFTHTLDHASMAIVLDAISKIGVDAGTEKLEF